MRRFGLRTAMLLTALVLLFSLAGCGAKTGSVQVYNSADELAGKKIGAVSGTSAGDITLAYFDNNVTIEYFNTNADSAVALSSGKIDAYISDQYAAMLQREIYTDQKTLEDTPVKVVDVGIFFRKDDAFSADLCSKLNTLIAEYRENGYFAEMESKWMSSSPPKIDIPLSGENGTLTYSCCTAIGKPFCFIQDNEIVGYEIELVCRFCERYGYGLNIVDTNFGGMLTDVASGKSDLGGTSTTITPERQEQYLFSDPTTAIKFVLTVKNSEGSEDNGGFFSGIAESFRRTFIEESRWKLFLSGIGETLLITVVSIVLGTLIGYAVYLLCFSGNKAANLIVNICMKLVHGLPVVVLLMVFYYVIFGSTSLNGTAVSIIAFSVIFGCSFLSMLRNSYNAIDPGQMEAAYALGYTRYGALRKRILPQMAEHFLPVFEKEVVGLIKATAIVGYIAVTDLTKVSDIIRGRTYEAFFPVVATAVIYFVLAELLAAVVKMISGSAAKRRHSKKNILKGVTVNDPD